MADYSLLCGDCLELMKSIPDGSINVILADLPYGVTNCEWDVRISIDRLWEQYKRVICNNGIIALFGTEPFASRLRISNLEQYKYDWVWVKNTCTGFQHAKNMPMKNYETISIFSPASMGHVSILGGHRMPYNPQGVKQINKVCNRGLKRFVSVYGKRPSQKDIFVQEGTGYPKMVLHFDSVSKRTHPTEKPVPLLEYLIRTYTNEGETVLDNVMGSGSTGVACVNTGRNFIGMELDEHYFEIASKRIQEAESSRAKE